jgi:hypothetical protein
MKHLKLLPILLLAGFSASAQCKGDCCKKKETTYKCKLTTPELRERKATVIADLKKLIKDKKELKDGYAYKFSDSDEVLTKLNEFIKSEKECCDFLSFNITTGKNKSHVWLEITGEEGVKDFIRTEIEM